MELNDYLPYLAVVLVAIPFLMLFRHFVSEFLAMKRNELMLLSNSRDQTNRYQAYERIALYLERIKPSYLIHKFNANLEIHESVFLMEKIVKEEFDYNLSQQIFIKPETWADVVHAKNYVIKTIKESFKDSKKEMTTNEFNSIFLLNYMKEDDFVQLSIISLQNDIQSFHK